MHWKKSLLAKGSKGLRRTPLGAPVEQVNRAAARATYRVHDRVLSNPGSRRRFSAQLPTLDLQQKRVLDGLKTRGVSVLSLEEFFPGADEDLWTRLKAESDRFAGRVEAELAERNAKEAARERSGKAREKPLGKGDYIFRALGKEVPKLPPDDPWLELGLSDRMLDVVNSYLGLMSKLTYVDLWYTPPAAPGVERVSSQRWHRDYNDRRLVKVFLYLTDVDERTGPLEYVPGSALDGEYAGEWPWRPVGNSLYPPQDEFAERVPESAQMALTGPARSLIFCNTSGFHRGGYATGDRPRVMAVYNYSSPASLAALTLRNFAVEVSRDGLSEQASFALTD
jgi:hypothetical protein